MNDSYSNITLTESIHPDFFAIKNQVYDANGFFCSHLSKEEESTEYEACAFRLNDLLVRFRVAKITPSKVGQFVTVWKRSANGPIQPYDISDPVDFFVVSTRHKNNFGHFVFPKSTLCEQDIVSVNEKGGKRGIRVYPPWDTTTSRQAQKTQKWQLNYFLETSENSQINFERARMLYQTRT